MRDWCRPEQGTRCFDQLPATVARPLTGVSNGPALDEPLLRKRFERVRIPCTSTRLGWRFLERHAGHLLFDRVGSDGLFTQLTAQFPSTTTAQVTTIHSGKTHGRRARARTEPGTSRRADVRSAHHSAPVLVRRRRHARHALRTDRSRRPLPDGVDLRAPGGGRSGGAASCCPRRSRALRRTSPCSCGTRTSSRSRHTEVVLAAASRAFDEGSRLRPRSASLMSSTPSCTRSAPDDPLVDAAAQDSCWMRSPGATFPTGTLVLLTADHGMSPVDPALTGSRQRALGRAGRAPGDRRRRQAARTGRAPAAISFFTFAKGRSPRCAPSSGSVSTAWPTSSPSTCSWPRASSPSRRGDCVSGSRTSSSFPATARRCTGTSRAASCNSSTASTAA